MDEAANGEDTLTNPPNNESMRAFRDNNASSDDECSSEDLPIESMPELEARESSDEDENEDESRGDPEEPFFMEREDDEDDDEASPVPVVEAPAAPSYNDEASPIPVVGAPANLSLKDPSADELRDGKASESKNKNDKEDEDNKPDQPPATL